jgi:hypothetical protein
MDEYSQVCPMRLAHGALPDAEVRIGLAPAAQPDAAAPEISRYIA